MMENLESFRHIRETVRAFAGSVPHRIVAANIGLETGPGEPAPNPKNERVPMARLDPRQRGLFGAAWTVGAMAELVPSGGIDAVTLGALAGEFALAEGAVVHPIHHVVAGMAQAAGRRVVAAPSSDCRQVASLAHETEDGLRLWVANLTEERQIVALPPLRMARGAVLDAGSFAEAGADPGFMRTQARPVGGRLEIDAYGVVCIESGR
jgi:hypothetical protein